MWLHPKPRSRSPWTNERKSREPTTVFLLSEEPPVQATAPCKIRQLATELTPGVKNKITEIPSQPLPIAREVCAALSTRHRLYADGGVKDDSHDFKREKEGTPGRAQRNQKGMDSATAMYIDGLVTGRCGSGTRQ